MNPNLISIFAQKLKKLYPELSPQMENDPRFFFSTQYEEIERSHPHFLWSLSPATDLYYAPVYPYFVHEIYSFIEWTNGYYIMARDGLLPLLWFFERMSLPSQSNKILIHHSFAPLVPNDWRPFVGTYQVIQDPQLNRFCLRKKENEKVLIHAIAMKGFLTLPYLRSQLKVLKEELDRQGIVNEKFEIFLSYRDDPYYRKESDQYNTLFAREFERTFGKKAKYLSHKEILKKDSFNDYWIFEINEKYYFADNFINFVALSKGARLLINPWAPANEEEKDIPISPFHQLRIRDECPLPLPSFQSRIEDIRNIILGKDWQTARLEGLWPEQFIEYIRILHDLLHTV